MWEGRAKGQLLYVFRPTMPKDLTYVVTGGYGFVGLRIVKMLAEKGTNIREIRVVGRNTRNFQPPDMGDKEINVYAMAGDVRDPVRMSEICTDADVVIHTAAVVDFLGSMSDDIQWDINVNGTENLLQCCENADVPCFVYTSSTAVIGPNSRGDPIENGDENTPYDTSRPLMTYNRTKAAAEKAVLRANGRKTNHGKTLHTCILRLGSLFGEGEMPVIKHILDNGIDLFAKSQPRVGRKATKSRLTYTGNVAWAHLLAAQKLLQSPETVGGEVFFVADDTPVGSDSCIHNAIFNPCGIRWDDNLVLPLWLLYFIAFILKWLSILMKPFYNFVPPLNREILILVNTNFFFSYKKATRLLGYKPLFTWEEAREKTAAWFVDWKARGATFSK
ncbi:3 beta-hydroxysteroid dehydrogenase type 7 [Branchiostoma belcheri]|nr:3 beta-hydroxysteroid dehydrogenase type 7 [Branchiostoma belcheri]